MIIESLKIAILPNCENGRRVREFFLSMIIASIRVERKIQTLLSWNKIHERFNCEIHFSLSSEIKHLILNVILEAKFEEDPILVQVLPHT